MSQKPLKRNLRANARAAASKVLDPLVRFAIETGVSVKELEELLRICAVRVVARRQSEKWGRMNVSGISATTGLSRTEVARILKTATSEPKIEEESNQVTNRVLRAWHQDPKYTDTDGKPLTMYIFGKGVSFESLVRCYGRGVPIRALLDELVDVDAIEVVNSKMVRAKSNVAIYRGLQPKMIESFGERATELLESMLENLRDNGQPKFIATVEARKIPADALALIRREVMNRGAIFLSNLEGSLFPDSRSPVRARADRCGDTSRASVTVFYYDDAGQQNRDHLRNAKIATRRNLRRRSNSSTD